VASIPENSQDKSHFRTGLHPLDVMKIWNLVGLGIAAVVCTVARPSKGKPRRLNSGVAKGKRVVILGGGFAGAAASQELSRLLPEADNGEIVLVDEHDYLLFTPMLTEAVGGKVEAHHITVPLESVGKRVRTQQGTVKDVDLRSHTVSFEGPEAKPLSADILVLALGSSVNFHHVPGAEDRAFTVKTLEDAEKIRESALSLVKGASRESDPAERAAMLTFVIAGGGYTGVETIAALNEMVRENVKAHSDLKSSEVRMIIAEPLGRLMSEVSEDLATYTQRELEQAGIDVRLRTGIKSVNGDEIHFSNGEKIRARTFIWAAGVEANELMPRLGAPTGKSKGLKVDSCLALSGYRDTWATGDCAEIPQPGKKGHYAPTAQNATREGKHVAQNIVRTLKGEAPVPFKYTPIGELAIVGRRRGVARVYGHNFSGLVAWAMWRVVYIAKMPSMSQRLRVLGDWVLDATLGAPAEHHYQAVRPRHDRAAAAGQ